MKRSLTFLVMRKEDTMIDEEVYIETVPDFYEEVSAVD